MPHAINVASDRTARETIFITAFNETKTLQEWSRDERCKPTRAALWKRLDVNWNAELAIATPRRIQKEPEPALLTAFGETKTIAVWSCDPRCRTSLMAMYHRRKDEWEDERIITEPSKPFRKRGATECLKGHSLKDETNVYTGGNGHRRCRICLREKEARRPPRKK